MTPTSTARTVVRIGSAAAAALSLHAVVNARLLRRPPARPPAVTEGRLVSVLVPARDEERSLGGCLTSVLAQRGVPSLEVLVLDDASADRTGEVAAAFAASDGRLRVVPGGGQEPPPGWLGKPWACARLADAARGDVLVFLDADVTLEPDAVAASVALLDETGLDLVSPSPRQVAVGAAERLVQPLLSWSWLSTLPLRVAERSPRPSLAAANGQLLVVGACAYHTAGGHAAVRNEVLDDVALLRAFKRSGFRGTVADGSRIAQCRMYDGWRELAAGYEKSLWSAFGSPAGAATVAAALLLGYVVPPVAALRGSRVGALGYAAGVAGRVVTGRATGVRVWPDALAHPASVVTFVFLLARSLAGRRRGTLRWKGRAIR